MRACRESRAPGLRCLRERRSVAAYNAWRTSKTGGKHYTVRSGEHEDPAVPAALQAISMPSVSPAAVDSHGSPTAVQLAESELRKEMLAVARADLEAESELRKKMLAVVRADPEAKRH